MNMKIVIFALSAVSALSGGVLYFAPGTSPDAQAQATPQVQTVESVTPSAPAIQSRPSPDAFATYQAQASLNADAQAKAASENLEAARLLADSQNRLAESNERAAQIYAAQQQNDNDADVAIAVASAQKAQAEAEAIRNQADLTEAENKRAALERQYIYDWALLVVVVIIAAIVLFGIVVFVRGWMKPVEVSPDEQESEEEQPEPMTGYIGGVDIRPFAQFSFQALTKIAKGVTDGQEFTCEVWTPNTMSKKNFERLQHLMYDKRLADWKGVRNQVGMTLTAKGKQFFRALGYPPPPPAKPVDFLPIPGRHDTIRHDLQAGQGGGL